VIGAPVAVGGVAIGTILFWLGVALLVIAALILLYLLIQWVASRPRPVPKPVPKAKPKPKARPKAKPKPRPKKKPLTWNPSLSYSVVIGSGGVPGTLDTTAKLPVRAPLHAHHVWPKYVGGPIVQPLMSIRDTVHLSTVHPTLYIALAASAAAMGFRILPNAANLAFVTHLRDPANIADKTAFSAAMTGYYLGLNTITHPIIPPPAYTTGIISSFPRI
jgi:hypothetical protein